MFIQVAAAGTRQIETRRKTDGVEDVDERLRPIALGLCLSMLMTAGYLAIHDRQHANSAERGRLAGMAFKRGPVCGPNDFSVPQPLGRDARLVEVKLLVGDNAGYAHPFDKPTDLLKWGIPVVRVAGRDYSYASVGNSQILTSVPASGDAAAVLSVAVSLVDGRRVLSAKLVEQKTQRMVFDQVWREEEKGARYCPEYATSSMQSEQPRKLITEALALQPLTSLNGQEALERSPADNRADAVIVSNIEALELRDLSNQGPVKGVSNETFVQRIASGNRNCPANIGLDGRKAIGSPALTDTGWAFMVGDRAFYPGRHEGLGALCAGDHAYLFSGQAGSGKYYLALEKRRLSDFSQVWSGIVVIPDQDRSTRENVLKVDAVDERADGLTIALTNEQSWTRMVVKAPLRLSP